MTAKEYLSQYQGLQRRIRSKQDEIEQIKTLMEGLAAIRYDKDKVESSPTNDQMINGMIPIEDISNKIARDVSEAAALADEITDRIGRVKQDSLEMVLREHYINGLSFEKICVNHHYEYRSIITIHGRALQEFTLRNPDIKDMT